VRDFDHKLVFIPGGSTGIGLAIARTLAARGADLALFARRPEPLAIAVDEVLRHCRRGEQRIVAHPLDVADADQVVAVFSATVAALGAPDVLINCAGRALPNYFERIPLAQFEETLRINLHGCWHTVQAALPHMRERGGYIVNVASLAGLIGVFGYTDYCASKFALVGFSEALRSELRRDHIAVSVLCPPDTETPGFATENSTKPPETRAVSAGASLLSADQVAEALVGGMARRKFLIIPGQQARLSYLVKRFAPRLVEHVVDWQVRSAQKRR
jgi:short-subunit dehydrogenase